LRSIFRMSARPFLFPHFSLFLDENNRFSNYHYHLRFVSFQLALFHRDVRDAKTSSLYMYMTICLCNGGTLHTRVLHANGLKINYHVTICSDKKTYIGFSQFFFFDITCVNASLRTLNSYDEYSTKITIHLLCH